jgi:hypothetical protein
MIDEQNGDDRYKAKPNCQLKAGQDEKTMKWVGI